MRPGANTSLSSDQRRGRKVRASARRRWKIPCRSPEETLFFSSPLPCHCRTWFSSSLYVSPQRAKRQGSGRTGSLRGAEASSSAGPQGARRLRLTLPCLPGFLKRVPLPGWRRDLRQRALRSGWHSRSDWVAAAWLPVRVARPTLSLACGGAGARDAAACGNAPVASDPGARCVPPKQLAPKSRVKTG